MGYDSRCIRHAVNQINSTYFLPAIQREFVWDHYRIEKLFDSIMGDYPIGSFLFWEIREENKRDWICYKFITDFDQATPHLHKAALDAITKNIYFVLDGQQRLTAMNIGLKGTYRYLSWKKWRTTQLYLNLLKPMGRNQENPEELEFQFKFREPDESYNPDNELWYKVGNILDKPYDAEQSIEKIEKEIEGLDKDQQKNARRLVGRLHSRIHTGELINYAEVIVPTYDKTVDEEEVKSETYDKIFEVFVRANTGGMTLGYSQILFSTAITQWNHLDARVEIENFTDAINAIGQYSFGQDFVLKGAMYLTDGVPIQYKLRNFIKPNLIKIENNWSNIKSGIETSVKLINKFGFNNKNITSVNALLPIAYYLLKLNKKNYIYSANKDDVENQMVIQRWLILVLLKNSFGGSSDTTLNILRTVLSTLPDYSKFPFGELNKKLGIEDNFNEVEIENLLNTNYGTKYSYLILSLLYPERDWKDKHYDEDHIFPKSQFTPAKLRETKYDDAKIKEYQKYFNTVLNLELLTPPENGEKNATDFHVWINNRDVNFKDRHSIPNLNSYSFDNFINFIEERKKIFQSKLKAI